MGREAEGWSLRRDDRTGVFFVRFRHAGRRFNRSTREKDARRAQERAATIFRRVTSGREGRRLKASTPLDELLALFLAEKIASDDTIAMMMGHAKAHLLPFFRTLESMDSIGIESYTAERLRQVRRSTVCKELSTLRQFLAWCHKRGVIDAAIDVPAPPKKATGTAHKNGNQVRVEMSHEMAERILDLLPERSPRTKFPVRAFFTVMRDTGLRYRTLSELRAPDDYHIGADGLRVRVEADKARFGRTLPITARAREALDSVCPEAGLIFGRASMVASLRKAAREAGMPGHQVKHLRYHDFRHLAGTEMGSVGDLPTVAFLLGHKHVTTTAKYVHASRSRAAKVLRDRGVGSNSGRETGREEDQGDSSISESPLVAEAGLEPALPREPDFESGASASSATRPGGRAT